MIDLGPLDLTRLQVNARQAARKLKALSNEKRLMILCQLGDRERSVGALQPLVGLSQSALSQHLALLRDEGLVIARRDGQAIYYRLADPSAVRIIATLAELYCPPDSPES